MGKGSSSWLDFIVFALTLPLSLPICDLLRLEKKLHLVSFHLPDLMCRCTTSWMYILKSRTLRLGILDKDLINVNSG